MSLTRTLALPCSTPLLPAAYYCRLNRLQHGSLRLHTDGQSLWFGRRGKFRKPNCTCMTGQPAANCCSAGDIGFAEAYRDGLLDTRLTALLRLALRNEQVLGTPWPAAGRRVAGTG
jgi:cyclopropane-fatty-acyl-phospholipid synthase